MAQTSYDYFFSGDHESARRLVEATLQQEGYRLETVPNGSTRATRGDLTRTLLLGALAGKAFHTVLFVQWFVDDQQRLVARLSRDLGSGLVKGGALGANKAHNAFVEVAGALGRAASAGGQLADTREA